MAEQDKSQQTEAPSNRRLRRAREQGQAPLSKEAVAFGVLGAAGMGMMMLLPGALPVLITGMRIGFFICFASVLGGETISSVAGIGRNIALAAELMESARMYAWIVFVIFTSVTLNLLVYSLENHIRSR